MTKITAALTAFKDISEDIKSEYKSIFTGTGIDLDVWVFTPSHMLSKKTRALNKQLGIKNLNYHGNKNQSKNK